MSRKYSFAVLLCRFSDDQRGFVSINRQNVVDMFTAQGVENVVKFWSDMSFGQVDLSGSKAYPIPDSTNAGWLMLGQKRSDYQGSGMNPQGRQDLVDWSKAAARGGGIPVDSFDGVVVYMSTAFTDLWGNPNQVVCDAASNLTQILQEIGHGLGLETHSRAVSSRPVDYMDPYCIMSGMTFGNVLAQNVTFQGQFGTTGPGLCAPYIAKMGWLGEQRIARVAAPNGISPRPTIVLLSALGDQSPANAQAAVFDLREPFPMTYFVEYRAGGWDRGLQQNAVVVHQYRPDGYAYYAGNIPTSTAVTSDGTTLVTGSKYLDSQADLLIQLLSIQDGDSTVAVQLTSGAGLFAGPAPSTVTAVSRFSDQLDLFTVGFDGGVYSTFWNAAGDWFNRWFRLIDANFFDEFTVPPQSELSVLSRYPNHMDLFVVGRDSAIYSTFWDAIGNWSNPWFRLGDANFPDGFKVPIHSVVSSLSRYPDHMDLFVSGFDGGVYSTFWDANGGWFNLDYAHDQRFERWSARLVWPLLSKSAPIFPGPSSFLRI
jgi:hypothetical protein